MLSLLLASAAVLPLPPAAVDALAARTGRVLVGVVTSFLPASSRMFARLDKAELRVERFVAGGGKNPPVTLILEAALPGLAEGRRYLVAYGRSDPDDDPTAILPLEADSDLPLRLSQAIRQHIHRDTCAFAVGDGLAEAMQKHGLLPDGSDLRLYRDEAPLLREMPSTQVYATSGKYRWIKGSAGPMTAPYVRIEELVMDSSSPTVMARGRIEPGSLRFEVRLTDDHSGNVPTLVSYELDGPRGKEHGPKP